jgi:hypothetical protein
VNGKCFNKTGAVLSTYVNIETKIGRKRKKEMLKCAHLKNVFIGPF